MNCILNHCHEQVAMDVAVIVFYAIAVGVMIVFALLSQSRTIQLAALLIAGVWVISIVYFLAVGGVKHLIVALSLDCAIAYQFWRMSRYEIFPAVLCCLVIVNVAFNVTAVALTLSEFWTVFVLNRIFELTLAYIIGASIYRIRMLKPPEIDHSEPGDKSLKFLAG